MLLDCERGAFGTKPQAHRKGAVIGKLLDHPYQVFFPNLDLLREIARNLARTFNQTGLVKWILTATKGVPPQVRETMRMNCFQWISMTVSTIW